MKKINLNELFCGLDLPPEELPKIHLNEDVSYKNVQKKVFAKIDSMEITKPEPKKSGYKKHIMFCIAAAAAIIAGGVTTYSISNAGKNTSDKTLETIDSSQMEIVANDNIDDINNIDNELDQQRAAIEKSSYSKYEDVYKYKVTGNMDGIDVGGVKYYCDKYNTWIIVHFKSKLSDGTSILDTKFEDLFSDNAHFGDGGISNVVMTSDSDDDNLYVAFGYLNSDIDPMENQYLLSVKNLMRKDTEKITELGLKNLMGFTNADIAAKKEYTPEMKERIANEFTKIDDYYYYNNDLLSMGELSIMVDMSEKDFDIDKNIIPASIDMYRGTLKEWPDVSSTIDELKAEAVGINNAGSLAGVLIKFTADNGYVLDDENLFKSEKAVPYTIDPETGIKKYLDSESMTLDTYADLTGTTNNGIPCIYHRIEFTSNNAENVYLDIDCEKLYNSKTNSIISNGKIKMNVYFGDISDSIYYISDSFTTDNGIDINLAFNYMQIKWDSKKDNKLSNILNDNSSNKFYDLNVVMKNGFKCPVRMHILKNDDDLVISTGLMLVSAFEFDDISYIECNGQKIYETKSK